jgi:AmmeMemoRadiSam system protein A
MGQPESAMDDVYLPPESQLQLLTLARRRLEQFVRGLAPETEAIEDPHLQSSRYGAFVTLSKHTELRGCIGNCTPVAPLYQIVLDMTEAAASRDHRVDPISETELKDIRIDISVLSPLSIAHDPLSLVIGKHGLYVARQAKRAVLLPQVAARYNWDITTFLEQTCLKAGLRKQAWRDSETQLSSFTTLVIEERL